MSRTLAQTLVIIALVAGVGFYLLHQWGTLVGHDDVRFVDEANAAIALHAGYAKQIDRLKRSEAGHTTAARHWRAVADTASTEAAKTDAWKGVSEECETALRACSERALLAEARVRALEPLLQRGIAIADCRLLGMGFLPRCPSRTASFLGGATLATTVVLLLR